MLFFSGFFSTRFGSLSQIWFSILKSPHSSASQVTCSRPLTRSPSRPEGAGGAKRAFATCWMANGLGSPMRGDGLAPFLVVLFVLPWWMEWMGLFPFFPLFCYIFWSFCSLYHEAFWTTVFEPVAGVFSQSLSKKIKGAKGLAQQRSVDWPLWIASFFYSVLFLYRFVSTRKLFWEIITLGCWKPLS